jgi:hypothetical protein
MPRPPKLAPAIPRQKRAHDRSPPGEARPVPSLRAGLNTAQQERATQLALASGDTLWASSQPVPPGSEWLIRPNREVSGPRAVPLHGLAAPKSLAA